MEHLRLDKFLNLSIIIPALVGVFVFSVINKDYRYFIVSICLGAVHEFNAEFKFINGQFTEFLYSLASTQLILFLYFKWDAKKPALYKKYLLHGLIFLLVVVDQYYDYISIYHIKWALILSMIGISLYGIRLLTQVQNNLMSERVHLSRKLIIIPFMVFSVYYAAINILMHYLFNANTKPIFLNLYNVIRWINFLSYISYTLALIWAPKKEIFL